MLRFCIEAIAISTTRCAFGENAVVEVARTLDRETQVELAQRHPRQLGSILDDE